MQAAFVRAGESAQRLQRVAKALSEEIDEVTAPHGIPVANLAEDDSIVTTIERVIADRDAQVVAERERKATKG